jgi:hypothetical protein
MSGMLTTVIANVLLDPDLSLADKEHLKRWADHGDNVVWAKIEADADAWGIIPTGTARETVIRYSLATRRIAEGVTSGHDPSLEEKKRQRESLLELADKADALAKYYAEAEKFGGIAMFYQRFLNPLSELRGLHEQEAVLLRQRAGKEPTPTTFVSRQSGGKGRRIHSRQYNAFMFLMTDHITEICGKPHYDAVSNITNIAFLKANVTTDHVRNACRATTRRRRSIRTSK